MMARCNRFTFKLEHYSGRLIVGPRRQGAGAAQQRAPQHLLQWDTDTSVSTCTADGADLTERPQFVTREGYVPQ
jgi:hypothetical protein